MVTVARKLMDAPAVAGGYSCNLTIGTGGGAYGYDTGLVTGTYGSIDAEPIPGEILEAAAWTPDGSYLSVYFNYSVGLVDVLQPLDFYINGVNYGGAGIWDDSSGIVVVFEVFAGPTLTSGTYLVEFK